MYNNIFGKNQLKDILLKILNKTEGDFGRFRDIYIDKKKEKIGVYTRNGGGNRDYYQDVFKNMSEHSLYAYDEDDDFDSTYATIYFNIPNELKENLLKFGEEDKNTQWLKFFQELDRIKQ